MSRPAHSLVPDRWHPARVRKTRPKWPRHCGRLLATLAVLVAVAGVAAAPGSARGTCASADTPAVIGGAPKCLHARRVLFVRSLAALSGWACHSRCRAESAAAKASRTRSLPSVTGGYE